MFQITAPLWGDFVTQPLSHEFLPGDDECLFVQIQKEQAHLPPEQRQKVFNLVCHCKRCSPQCLSSSVSGT